MTLPKTIADATKKCEEKLKQLETKFDNKLMELTKRVKQLENVHIKDEQLVLELNQKITNLQDVVKHKDEQLLNLTTDLVDIKKGMQFISDKSDDIAKENKEKDKKASEIYNKMTEDIKQAHENVAVVKEKTEDLEDRSRRNNLVFFNIPETDNANGTAREDCEKLIMDELAAHGLLGEYNVYVDRAHRLGPRKRSHKHPRPIIVRFTYYKQKQELLQKSKLLKDSVMNMSEDYSRETLAIHKKLRATAKDAKDNLYMDPAKCIVRYHVTYRKVVITYALDKNDKSSKTFSKSFSLDSIRDNVTWYIPPPPPKLND